MIVTSILYNWKSHGCTIYHVTSDALWYIKSDIRLRLFIKNAGKSTLRFVIQSVSEKRDIFRNFEFSIAVLSDFASLTVSSFDIVSIVQFILINIHRSRGRNFVWVATAESELFTVIFYFYKKKQISRLTKFFFGFCGFNSLKFWNKKSKSSPIPESLFHEKYQDIHSFEARNRRKCVKPPRCRGFKF